MISGLEYRVGEPTLAVVLLQDLKASPAAAMASFVWARVISGTVPSSALLAGSGSGGQPNAPDKEGR